MVIQLPGTGRLCGRCSDECKRQLRLAGFEISDLVSVVFMCPFKIFVDTSILLQLRDFNVTSPDAYGVCSMTFGWICARPSVRALLMKLLASLTTVFEREKS